MSTIFMKNIMPPFLTYSLCFGKFHCKPSHFSGKKTFMDPRFQIGRILIVTGVIFVLLGLMVINIDKIPLIGRLPGDINVRGKNWSFHFPIVTGLIISLILTILLNFFFRR